MQAPHWTSPFMSSRCSTGVVISFYQPPRHPIILTLSPLPLTLISSTTDIATTRNYSCPLQDVTQLQVAGLIPATDGGVVHPLCTNPCYRCGLLSHRHTKCVLTEDCFKGEVVPVLNHIFKHNAMKAYMSVEVQIRHFYIGTRWRYIEYLLI